MPHYIQYQMSPVDKVSELSDYLNDTGSDDLRYHIDGSDDDKGIVCIVADSLEYGQQWVESGLTTYGLTVVKKTNKEISKQEYDKIFDDD